MEKLGIEGKELKSAYLIRQAPRTQSTIYGMIFYFIYFADALHR